jgi:hypothetical protein
MTNNLSRQMPDWKATPHLAATGFLARLTIYVSPPIAIPVTLTAGGALRTDTLMLEDAVNLSGHDEIAFR